MININKFVSYVKQLYDEDEVLLHRPLFSELEKRYVNECIDSNFVSSVGKRVIEFEEKLADYTGAKYAIACVNGTAALHAVLRAIGVDKDTQVLTQAISFVATSNAISYCGAEPVFIDVDKDTLGLSPWALQHWLEQNTIIRDGRRCNKQSGKAISCCLPMHTFGLPCRINEIAEICAAYAIPLIEDCAESLGSFVDTTHTGLFGEAGTFSFNGNKTITTGGGGMIITNNLNLANKLKHITTTAKKKHPYEYYHDEIGYNYRMPNLNAALGVAQMQNLDQILYRKKEITAHYVAYFKEAKVQLVAPINGHTSNNWLNAILLSNRKERDYFLKGTNELNVMTRPIWNLLSQLPMYQKCQNDGLENSKWLVDRIVNIPSSAPRLD